MVRSIAAISIFAIGTLAFTRGEEQGTQTSPTPTAFEVNKGMGIGFNLGNTFDLGLHSTKLTDVAPLIDLYTKAGMRHIRIPVTWGSPVKGDILMNSQGQFDANKPRIKDLDNVVDYALKKGLFVIVNTHHEHWIKEKYDGSAAYNNSFANLWTGIARHYKDRSPKLIFEILNEPEKAFGDWSGPVKPFDPQAIKYTRQINEVGWTAVRSVSKTRVVMIGVNGQGNQSLLDDVYPSSEILPGAGKDKYLIATVHTYDPWPFCGQDGTADKWPGINAIIAPIKAVAAHGRKLGLPINYGEFGVGRRQTPSERNTDIVRSYYRAVKQTADLEGMSVTPWDDRGWFGLVESSGQGKFRFVYDIVPSMMKK